jgi:hypothetical protein
VAGDSDGERSTGQRFSRSATYEDTYFGRRSLETTMRPLKADINVYVASPGSGDAVVLEASAGAMYWAEKIQWPRRACPSFARSRE